MADEMRTTSWLMRGIGAAAVFVAAASILQRLLVYDFPSLIWSDRDLWRSARVLIDWPTTGAEMNYGGGARVPGGVYHYLLAIPLAFRGASVDAFQFLLVLEGLALAVLSTVTWRRVGPVAAGITALVFVSACDARRPLAWLWNPTLLPFFMTVGLVSLERALHTGSRWSLCAWAGFLALAAQAHATGAGWLLSTALGLALWRRDLLREHGLAALGAAVATFVPYLLSEVLRGGPNTAELMRQGDGLSRGGTLGIEPAVFVEAVRMVVPTTLESIGRLDAITAVATLSMGGLMLTGLVAAARAKGSTAVWVRILAMGVLLSACAPAISSTVHAEWRYMTAALPAAAVVAGFGAQTLVRGWSRGGAALGVVLMALATWSPGVTMVRFESTRVEGTRSQRGGEVVRAEIQERTGLMLDGVAGRLALLEDFGEGWRLQHPNPLDHELHRRGLLFPGSQAPPCFAVYNGPGEMTPEDLGAALGQPVTIEQTFEVDLQGIGQEIVPVVLEYRPAGSRCQITTGGRYVPTPMEAELRPLWNTLEVGQVAALSAAGGYRAAAMLSGDERGNERVMVGVAMHRADGDVIARFESNQLRGRAYNGSWFEEGLAGDPTLVFERGEERHELVFYGGLIGLTGVVPPFEARLPLPSGTWRVTLQLDLYPRAETAVTWPFEPGRPTTRRVVVAEALELP